MSLIGALGIGLAGLTVAGGGAVAVLVITTSGPFSTDDGANQEDATADATATAATTNTVTTPTQSASPASSVTSSADLSTYRQPPSQQSDGFSFRYPQDWIVRGGTLEPGVEGLAISAFSFDPAAAPGSPDIPQGEMKVGILVAPDTVTMDCATSSSPAATLGELNGRERTRNAPFTESHELHLSRIVSIEARTVAFTYCLVGYFTADPPDERIFRAIAESFMIE